MKAQQEILTPLLITGIMISIIGSVYLWGVPLIQKNEDIANLQRAEDFMRNLDIKIKNVANTGSRDRITIDSGTLSFASVAYDSAEGLNAGSVKLEVMTKGTIYSTGIPLPFVRDSLCHKNNTCVLGEDEPEWFFAQSDDIGGQYLTTYELTYRQLNIPSTLKGYQINLTGNSKTAGRGHDIVVEYKGTVSGNPTITNVELKIL